MSEARDEPRAKKSEGKKKRGATAFTHFVDILAQENDEGESLRTRFKGNPDGTLDDYHVDEPERALLKEVLHVLRFCVEYQTESGATGTCFGKARTGSVVRVSKLLALLEETSPP